MNAYDLPITEKADVSQQNTNRRMYYTPLPLPLLVQYALWFCNFRWLFIALLTVYGILGFFPAVFERHGLHTSTGWAFVVAFILSALNIVYIQHLKKKELHKGILTNIWIQIVLDLIILTSVIHFAGILETYVSFAYLFHIVLACIFFPGHHSLIVMIIVCFLYVGAVTAERVFFVSSTGIYNDSVLRNYYKSTPTASILNIITALCIWAVVWYLASHLSNMVREREYELVKTNIHLKEAQEAKTKHLLRITHELKAPFAAIDANVQLLLKGHCGFFTDSAVQVLDRIALRSRKLGQEIQEMLQLANLSSENKESLIWKDVDLSEVIKWCVTQIQPMAEKRMIFIDEDLEPIQVKAVEDHMKMFFINLISNAVIYSYNGGTVKVKCKKLNGTGPTVTIADQGIGIPGEKLPKIFDEYYRTDEANSHNKNSTGLGLAIVKHVAQTHKISVRVSSSPGAGTTFTVTLPSQQQLV